MAGLVALPLLLLVCIECAQTHAYNTGTDSVEVHGYVARAGPDEVVCVPGLLVPAGTARVRLRVFSFTYERPSLHLALEFGTTTVRSNLGRLRLRGNHASSAVFSIPQQPAEAPPAGARACLTADESVSWGGTHLAASPTTSPATVANRPLSARIAIWYLPPAGAKQSYLSAAWTILHRASLFRPGWIGPWLYVVMLLLVLPSLAVVGLRCLALAVAGNPPRRLGAWLFAIAALNFACWALITPPFQAPDETDHFAYAQSLVERGQAPSRHPYTFPRRWSSAESLALEVVSFETDHRAADSRPPWVSLQEQQYTARVARLHPRADDGGGYETAAAHGPIYYATLAPAYLAAGSSPFSQLTLMRLTSALIGALTVLFTFLLARELIPGRPWLAVIAALLVAYEPMYGFISGTVNNDSGVNAAAAALALLLVRMLRRGITVPSGALTGVILLGLPVIKGTGLSLYPVAALVFVVVLWRHHTREDLPGWIALLAGATLVGLVSALALGGLHTSAAPTGAAPVGANATAVGGALHDIPDFLAYFWQVFLPRLSFMTPHFPASGYPAYSIFVVRGWAAFGSYNVAFPSWVYSVVVAAMVSAIPLWALAARREWGWIKRHRLELLVLALMPTAVIFGVEAAYYTPGVRPVIAEVGRYAFPAIGPLALLVVGALHAFGRRQVLALGVALLVVMIVFSYASQLLTLTSFYA
jgi:Predicted membrane protein (DUF2142)